MLQLNITISFKDHLLNNLPAKLVVEEIEVGSSNPFVAVDDEFSAVDSPSNNVVEKLCSKLHTITSVF